MHIISYIVILIAVIAALILSYMSMPNYDKQLKKAGTSVTDKDKKMMMAAHILFGLALLALVVWNGFLVFGGKCSWSGRY